MKRMREKMVDQSKFYTFDVFEEKILYSLCSYDAVLAKIPIGKMRRELVKDKIAAARIELREKFKLSVKRTNDYSKKMYLASAMLLKDSEDENLIFWDDDYDIFWNEGFIKGIGYLKSLGGQYSGYGYKYTCEIFSDLGIKPPLLLLGTEEANRIANEEQQRRYIEKMDEHLGEG